MSNEITPIAIGDYLTINHYNTSKQLENRSPTITNFAYVEEINPILKIARLRIPLIDSSGFDTVTVKIDGPFARGLASLPKVRPTIDGFDEYLPAQSMPNKIIETLEFCL